MYDVVNGLLKNGYMTYTKEKASHNMYLIFLADLMACGWCFVLGLLGACVWWVFAHCIPVKECIMCLNEDVHTSLIVSSCPIGELTILVHVVELVGLASVKFILLG